MRAARGLKQRAGGAITVIHVRPHSEVRAAVLEERGDLLKAPEGTLKESIDTHYQERMSAVVGTRKDESWKIASGRAAVEITREAKRGYDLVVAASRGLGSVGRLLLGSTVQELLQSSPIPVLVLPAR